jgi:hypothetical protein
MIKFIGKVALGAVISLGLAVPASAGTPGKYQVTWVPGQLAAALSDIQMPADRAGKLKLKMAGSDKDGLGGYTSQVAGNGKLTCASNPDSKGLCGPKDNPQPAVLVLNWKVLANIEIENVAELRVTGGKIVFLATGKNKTSAAGNVAASTIYETPVATGYATINDRAAGHEDPVLGCGGAPTAFKTECYNAFDAMSAGFVYGYDLTNACSTDAECELAGPTLYCNPAAELPGGTVMPACQVQTCTVDGDCNSGACNIYAADNAGGTKNCCDPAAIEGGAGYCEPAPSPSGAFLDNVQF